MDNTNGQMKSVAVSKFQGALLSLLEDVARTGKPFDGRQAREAVGPRDTDGKQCVR